MVDAFYNFSSRRPLHHKCLSSNMAHVTRTMLSKSFVVAGQHIWNLFNYVPDKNTIIIVDIGITTYFPSKPDKMQSRSRPCRVLNGRLVWNLAHRKGKFLLVLPIRLLIRFNKIWRRKKPFPGCGKCAQRGNVAVCTWPLWATMQCSCKETKLSLTRLLVLDVYAFKLPNHFTPFH